MKNEAGGGGSLQGNELKLDDQCLSSLPGWVVETPRHAAVLKILYLNKNQFTRLPALLGLPHLEKLNMAGNSLSVIHAGVLPPSLLVLELINNQITTIEPGAFAALRKLRHLDLGANLLAGEALDGAAAELAGCRDLAVVDISCNRVRALPPSLVALAAAVQVAILLDFKSEGGRAVVHCANVGDARAVLCREHGGVRLSRDFKPFDDDEYRDPRTRPPHTTRREPLPVEYYRSASPTTAGTIASCLSAASYHCATGVASATTSRSRGRSATSTLRGTLSPSRIATRSRLTSSTARSSRSAATGCGTSSRTNRRWMPSSRPPRSTNAAPRRFATLRSCTGRQTTSAAATATSRRRHHLN